MLPSCSSCRNNCTTRLTEADREQNFQNFWQLGNVVQQRKFIYDHIKSREPARRKVQNSIRSVSLQYFLNVEKNNSQIQIKVCKEMFKNTLSISSQFIQGVVSKYANTGFVDLRGKHQRTLTKSQQLAKEHVRKYPNLNIDKKFTKVQLYNEYIRECEKLDIEPIKESNYRDIFDRFHKRSANNLTQIY